MSSVRLACCQISPDVERPRVELAGEAITAAVDGGAQIVVLPQLANSGYVFESAREARGGQAA